jgi:hypothetical protein
MALDLDILFFFFIIIIFSDVANVRFLKSNISENFLGLIVCILSQVQRWRGFLQYLYVRNHISNIRFKTKLASLKYFFFDFSM